MKHIPYLSALLCAAMLTVGTAAAVDATSIEATTPDATVTLWTAENGVFDGDTTQTALCTRAMVATLLWQMADRPTWDICYPYADVEADLWYTDAIYWCTVNRIVTGHGDETFRPDDAITREQLLTILYRYAQFRTLDVSVGEDTNILSYPDVFDVSAYAIPAFQWACGTGLLGENPTTLQPQQTVSPDELVALCERFSKLR